MWSKKLYHVSLLESYISPTPVVSDLVRRQLVRTSQQKSIRNAIRRTIRGEDHPSVYFLWLSYSGIDFENRAPAIVAILEDGTLERVLFDMNLGQRVKSYQLNFYSEVHEVRDSVKGFLFQVRSLVSQAPSPQRSLWWDGVSSLGTPHSSWISATLEADADFERIFQSWSDDSEWLQHWLDDFEAKTAIVNNPGSRAPVFSELSAIDVVRFMEV